MINGSQPTKQTNQTNQPTKHSLVKKQVSTSPTPKFWKRKQSTSSIQTACSQLALTIHQYIILQHYIILLSLSFSLSSRFITMFLRMHLSNPSPQIRVRSPQKVSRNSSIFNHLKIRTLVRDIDLRVNTPQENVSCIAPHNFLLVNKVLIRRNVPRHPNVGCLIRTWSVRRCTKIEIYPGSYYPKIYECVRLQSY
jgi:hypothetical protein